jgi:hypothetical protein
MNKFNFKFTIIWLDVKGACLLRYQEVEKYPNITEANALVLMKEWMEYGYLIPGESALARPTRIEFEKTPVLEG